MKKNAGSGRLLLTLTILFIGAHFLSAAPAYSDTPKYLGYKKCIGCHNKEYKSWKDGTMNLNAFKALLPGKRAEAKEEAGLDPKKDYTIEPECLKCHATGHGEPGGFNDYRETPDLAGITCEFCHGPGEYYWKIMAKERHFYQQIDLIYNGLNVPNQAICDKCHVEGCPVGSDEMSFDKEAAHENFPLKGEH